MYVALALDYREGKQTLDYREGRLRRIVEVFDNGGGSVIRTIQASQLLIATHAIPSFKPSHFSIYQNICFR